MGDTDIFPLYVVIPNWNLKHDTVRCVESVLMASKETQTFIIVVDNGSTDGSRELIEKVFGDRVIQLWSERNRGFAGAVNLGVRYAMEHGAASILVLNNDTIVDQNMIKILHQAAQIYPDAGIIAPAIYYMNDPERIWRLGDRMHRWFRMPYPVSDREVSKEIVEVDFVTGCGMLIRRPVIEKVGLFDERFFMYYEDADFCKRARDHGFRILCVPGAKLWHKVSATARRSLSTNVYWRARSRIMFYRKHFGRGLTRILLVVIVLKLLFEGLRGWWAGCRPYSRALLTGVLDGFRARGDPSGGIWG